VWPVFALAICISFLLLKSTSWWQTLFPRRQPEDDYQVTITDEFVKVEHPKWDFGQVNWDEVHTVKLINTDRGPWQPDVWLTLVSDKGTCKIPLAAKGYEEVYDIVSKYEGFDFESETRSMSCTDNAEFILWLKPKKST
jgi:hypothetical protein